MDFQMNIPSKKNFKVSEVATLLGIKPYVLRFWESEFPQIETLEQEDGSRLYSTESFKVVEKIKELLFEQKLSIQEAKAWLDNPPHLEEEEIDSFKMLGEVLAEKEATEAVSFSSPMDGREKLAINLDTLLNTIDSIIEKNKWSN